MYSFGNSSIKKLSTCHPDIQTVMFKAIKLIDFTVLCGARTEQEQEQAFKEKRSKLRYPESKHNKSPSLAIDIAPWPIRWNDREQFYYMGGLVMGVANGLGIDLRYGGDWNRNGRIGDQSFDDLVHFELFGSKYSG